MFILKFFSILALSPSVATDGRPKIDCCEFFFALNMMLNYITQNLGYQSVNGVGLNFFHIKKRG